MKKIIMTSALVACAAVVAAQTVTSANVVGYSKQTAPGNGAFKIISNQFIADDEVGATLDEAFGDSLPENTELYAWDGGAYKIYAYFGWNGGWTDATSFAPAGTNVIERGNSLWVKNVDLVDAEVLVSGNVPVSSSTTNVLHDGFSLVSNPYPSAVRLDDLNISPEENDEIYLYDGTYTIYAYFGWNGGWTDATSFAPAGTVEIPVGVGFWYKTAVARDWVMPIPYNLDAD